MTMVHEYSIYGMTCNGCVKSATEALSQDPSIAKVDIDLKAERVKIEMSEHIEIENLQKLLDLQQLHYTIHEIGKKAPPKKSESTIKLQDGSGEYHCPMNCEGNKNYNQPGDCPVCGMDLIEEPKALANVSMYTCPMHPEVQTDVSGDCPICGMDLVPTQPAESNENKTYYSFRKKFILSLIFTLPIFIMAMSEMFPNNPLEKLISLKTQSWIQFALSIPVVFYAAWMFL